MGRIKKTLDLSLPFKAISTNGLYAGKKRRSWTYTKYRQEVTEYLSMNYSKRVKLEPPLILDMEVGFSSPLSDASNSVKGIEDIVSEYFGFNDRHIYELHVIKYLVDKGDEFMKIKIRHSRKDYDRRVKNGKRKTKG